MEATLTTPTRHFAQISQLIGDAHCITDLNVIIKQLIPLSELKNILLDKLSKLQQNSLSLHSVYFNSYPFDEIFNHDIICSIIQYLSGSNMYTKLTIINKNFNRIMRENPILYQQYKIQVTLSDDIWSEQTKKLYVNISHQLQCIEISSMIQQNMIPLNSKIAPDITKYERKHQINNIIIHSVEDMTNKCPFMWYAIKKWQIITHLNDYDNHDEILTTSLMEESPSLMEELLIECTSNIRSLQIDERIMSASPTGGIFGMYGLYTPRASSNLYLNYNHELNNNKKKHITSQILQKLISLNNLIHIEWITDESAPILPTLSFNTCKNIICLDLCGSHGYTMANNKLLSNLEKLLVLSIEFDDLRCISDNKDKQEDKEEIFVKFPINLEFIQLKNYDHANDINLDLSHCYNIIAIKITISRKTYKFCNMLKTIKWNNNDNGFHLIECLLIEYSHKSISPSHDVLHQECKALTKNKNNKKLPVKCIRCITNSYSHPICFQMGAYNDSGASTFSTATTETVDHFTYTNLIKGLEESNEDNNNIINISKPSKIKIKINDIIDSSDDDGILWKTLISDKFMKITDGEMIATEKILMYKKYFDMDMMKWIYHLGRDYGLSNSTSLGMFDTSSINNIPDISTMDINDRSTISNNININPQYNNVQDCAENASSSSAVFIVD